MVSRSQSVCMCWKVMRHLAIAMLLMTSCHGQPTYSGLKFTLFFYFHSLLCTLCNTSHPLKTQWHAQKKTTHTRMFWQGFRLSEEDVRTHTHTHFLQNSSKAEVMMTHWTPTHLCHNPEVPTRESCCLLSDLTPVSMVPVFPVQPKTLSSFGFSSLILFTPVIFYSSRVHASNSFTNSIIKQPLSCIPVWCLQQHNYNPVLPEPSNPNPNPVVL